MRSVIPRPFLLLGALIVIVGAIVFLQSRFGAATGESANGARPVAKTVRSEGATKQQKPAEKQTAQSGSGKGDSSAQSIAQKEKKYERAKEITDPTGFVNTGPGGVSIQQNLGKKVVLLDFWTYSCINCQHTQPHLNYWQKKYAKDGLEIIGVHRPEFGFEKDYNGVAGAVRQAGIKYPVVLDNSSATWNAYGQHYWPTMYLIDRDGFIRYKHIGEGGYARTEAKIKELLAEKNGG